MEEKVSFRDRVNEDLGFNIRNYFRYAVNRIAFMASMTLYFSLSLLVNNFVNLSVILCSLLCALVIPVFSIYVNYAEEKLQIKTAFLSIGRLGRVLLLAVFASVLFALLSQAEVIEINKYQSFGGFWGLVFFSAFSQYALQYISLSLFARNVGRKTKNLIFAVSINVLFIVLSLIDHSIWLKLPLLFSAFVFGGGVLFVGLFSDLRSLFYPQHGVGVFFGSFNPIHRVHMDVLKEFIAERNLSRVYIQCSSFNKFHLRALLRGEITLDKREKGIKLYKKTKLSDDFISYFPKGNRFFDYQLKRKLIEEAVKEAGLDHVVTVLDLKDTYETYGYYGVLKNIKRRHLKTPIHILHGSDINGMYIREVSDECGFFYPKAVRRRVGVSSRKIRMGHWESLNPSVRQFLKNLEKAKQSIQAPVMIAPKGYFENGQGLRIEHEKGPIAEA